MTTAATKRWAVLAALAGLLVALGIAAVLTQDAGSAAERITVRVGGVAVRVEVADDPAERAQGLMHRAELPRDAGMLFVYPEPQIMQFWMKNTPLDLDIGFFDANRRLLNVAGMQAYDERSRHRSRGPARYALETNRGWFAAHDIRPGAILELPRELVAR